MTEHNKRDFWAIIDLDTNKIVELREDLYVDNYSYVEHIMKPYKKEGEVSYMKVVANGVVTEIDPPTNIVLVALANRAEFDNFHKKYKERQIINSVDISEDNHYAKVRNWVLESNGMEGMIKVKHEPKAIKDQVLADIKKARGD